MKILSKYSFLLLLPLCLTLNLSADANPHQDFEQFKATIKNGGYPQLDEELRKRILQGSMSITNLTGKSILIQLLNVQKKHILFKDTHEKDYRYPLEKLIPEDKQFFIKLFQLKKKPFAQPKAEETEETTTSSSTTDAIWDQLSNIRQ